MQNASDRDGANQAEPRKRQRHPGEGFGRCHTGPPFDLFYSKHPEDDMTQLDIARQDVATLETAPTLYVEGHEIRFAYRRLGPATGRPLILLQHFSGNIDAWDPAVVNALATDRPVIAFDNAGVGRSTGQTPDNVAAMTRDAVAFISLLGLSGVDLLGFSLGGCVAQQIAAEHERLVRKLILVGTAPKGGEEHLLAVLQQAFSQTDAPDPRLPLFFTNSSASQSSGLAFLKRTKVRKDDRDTDNGRAVTDPQANALITWCATPDPGHAILRGIRQPALVVSGSHDTMLPASNAYSMFKELSNAQLILYPDSGHGALFQHHEMFVSHVRTFLDAQPAAA
jgi:pimeloyl-ACP methyl ester carboxylesterase